MCEPIEKVYYGAKGASMPAGLLHVYRIVYRYRDIPQCFLKWRIPEFRNTKRIIWVRTRKQRDELLCCDRSATYKARRIPTKYGGTCGVGLPTCA